MLAGLLRGRRTLFLIQVPVGLASLAVLLWRVDLREAIQRMPDVDLRWVVPGLIAFTISKLIHAYRWRLLLSRRDVPLGQLTAIFLTSNLVNALLPLRAGDLLRIELPRRRFGISRAELTGSVIVVESVLDGVAFVLLMSAGVLLLDIPLAFRPLLSGMALLVAVAFVATVAAARVDESRDFGAMRPVRWLPGRLRVRAATLLPQFVQGLASLRDTGGAIRAIGISLLAWLAEVSVYWMMGQAFGLDLGAALYLPIMIGANVIVSLPVTPWDLGPYEVAVTEIASLAGAGRALASSYAFGSHLLLIAWVSITGIVAMWTLDLRPRDLIVDGDEPASSEQGSDESDSSAKA